MIGLGQIWGTMLQLYLLRISAIGMKLDEMMHSNMKQIAIENDHARLILAHSTELSRIG